MNPVSVSKSDCPAELVEKELAMYKQQMAEDPKMANKPEQVLAKIAEGKLGVYFKDNCLLCQEFVKGEGESIEQYVASCGKKIGAPIKINSFVRFICGEGIEKRVDDFAGEIASMLK